MSERRIVPWVGTSGMGTPGWWIVTDLPKMKVLVEGGPFDSESTARAALKVLEEADAAKAAKPDKKVREDKPCQTPKKTSRSTATPPPDLEPASDTPKRNSTRPTAVSPASAPHSEKSENGIPPQPSSATRRSPKAKTSKKAKVK